MSEPAWMIVDGIAPFFRGCPEKRINWSKIPFDHVEQSGMLDASSKTGKRLRKDFAGYVQRAAAAGYDTITLDDLVHLIAWEGYGAPLQERLVAYRALYRELFAIARQAGLRVLLTSDVFSLEPRLADHLGRSRPRIFSWLAEALEQVFVSYPAVAGVVFRVGESDAIGTKGTFQSRLLIRTAGEANQFLRTVLPVFEKQHRTLFFRTWTVGAYPVGDLIWHRSTFRRVFAGIDSSHLVVSMKAGESDFFRYLPLNRHFFRTQLQTLVEFQTRREYEGFGEYPSFTGWEHERIWAQLDEAPNCVGASVWCQTGGWGKFKRLTWVHQSSVWVELNNVVTAAICRGQTCEEAVRAYCRTYYPDVDSAVFLAFLALADDVVQEGLYIREWATRKLFFRRLRVPPLLFPYWDRIMMFPALRQLLVQLVQNQPMCVEEGWRALRNLNLMRELAAAGSLPEQGLDFQYDTFRLLALLREYVFADPSDEAACMERFAEARRAYKKRWKTRYSVKCSFRRHRRGWGGFAWWRRLFLREKRGYRFVDVVITLRLFALLFPVLGLVRRRLLPKFTRKQAMGIDVVFK